MLAKRMFFRTALIRTASPAHHNCASCRREAEKEEIEARRAMPEHLRLKEDMDRANESRQRARGGQAFLSKYHHSGVFYAEDERTRELMERERRNKVEMQDQVLDMASLPKMMQVRDFGKRSRTKHTHLRDVDTTSQEAGWAKGKSGGGNACFNCGQTGHVCQISKLFFCILLSKTLFDRSNEIVLIALSQKPQDQAQVLQDTRGQGHARGHRRRPESATAGALTGATTTMFAHRPADGTALALGRRRRRQGEVVVSAATAQTMQSDLEARDETATTAESELMRSAGAMIDPSSVAHCS